MKLSEMVVPNKDFQTSINIDFDFGSRAKIENLIPTDSVCRYLEEIIRDVVTPSSQRAKLLVGAYGKGKSHVVLAALTAMWLKEPASFGNIISAYEEHRHGFGETFERFVTEGKRLLPVVISGSTADLRHSLLHSLRNALRLADLESLMPQTNYDGAIRVLERWRESYPETYRRFEELTGESGKSIISRLKSMDTLAYDTIVSVYPELTSGGTFDVLDGAEVIDVYEHVLDGLLEHDIDGIYVVYDEFSKYLETSIEQADTKLLQDFAEACNRSGSTRQLHLLLISHKSLSNYIDSNLPKEKVDGWRGVSGRFREIEMVDDANQYYELLSEAIVKDEDMWLKWLEEDNGLHKRVLRGISRRYENRGLFDKEIVERVAFGCYPLHPLTTYLLARMSEKVAQNERTLFTFICSNEEGSLNAILDQVGAFVSPDYVYDYFESLLRKEFYTSPLHKIYELTRLSLGRVDANGLEARIIKTIAAIDVVAQYDRVAPTRETLVELYTDCGFETHQIDEAIDRLVQSESVVYLRRSNAFLKLKESSGVRIDGEISDRAESLLNSCTSAAILNSALRDSALYPSRYNEDRGMVRYFDCGFVGPEELREWQQGERLVDGKGDGQVVAIYLNDSDALNGLKEYAKETLSREPMTVVVYPRAYTDIADTLYRLEAAKQLKIEAAEDEVLSEEYEIVIEDYTEVVEDYIAGFFQPELGRSLYYVDGTQKKRVTRRRRLSEELSGLCDRTFSKTPRITSESLNKNELTGTAFSSRSKILKALCGKSLDANFGFYGNGQETSMVRSAFEKTGIIANLAESATVPGNVDPRIERVLHEIRSFVETAQGDSFQKLYERLTGRELGIGLREGPIPIYLAYILRDYRDEIKITHSGEERALTETVLDDISRNPATYELTRLNWTPDMAEYVRGLADLFACPNDGASRNDVAEAIRLWYVELPQVTRNCKYDHSHGAPAAPIDKVRADFFKAIRRIETDTNVFLFEELPESFGYPEVCRELLDAIRSEKEACDTYLTETIQTLANSLIAMFDEDAHGSATLGSVLRDWVDRHPATTTHVFSGINSQVLNAIMAANGNDTITVSRLAKAATSLRVDDWNDARFNDFLKVVLDTKRAVEGYSDHANNQDGGQKLGIVFIDEEGNARQKTFDRIECGGRSRLLKNSLVACLNEMGGALRPEEKRQIVFEVLEGLC